MNYLIDFSDEASEGVHKHRKSGDKQAINKLNQLINELRENPTTGTGKPKRLTGVGGNQWSRRITDKHRLKYEIFEDTGIVEVLQTWGHYYDK